MAVNTAELEAAIAAVSADTSTPQSPTPEQVAPDGSQKSVAQEAKPEASSQAQEAKPEEISQEWLKVLERDRANYRAQQQLKQERETFEKLKRDQEDREQLMRSDPLEYARKFLPGDFYERMTKRLLNDGKPAPEERAAAVETDLERIKRENAELKEAMKQREEQTHVEKYMGDVKKVLADSKFKLTSSWPGIETEIQNLVGSWYETYQQILTPEEAVAKIDSVVRSRWAQLKQAEAPEVSTPPPAKPISKSRSAATAPQTLTNDMATTTDADLPEDLPWEERKRRLAKSLTWTGVE